MSKDKLKVGDRVHIRTGKTVFTILEVDVTGAGQPAPPATYLVRMAPASGKGIEQVYGDTALVKVP